MLVALTACERFRLAQLSLSLTLTRDATDDIGKAANTLYSLLLLYSRADNS